MTTKEPRSWANYEGPDSLPAGEYLWRTPHKTIDDVIVIFRAKVRIRGHGYGDDVLSPEFDHWDGYQLHMPADTQFIAIEDDDPRVTIEDVYLLPCPFCGETPIWATYDGFIGSKPNSDKGFTVSHCIAKAHRTTPQSAADIWNTRPA